MKSAPLTTDEPPFRSFLLCSAFTSGSSLGPYRRWGAKAWGANRIRYPGSPCRKRRVLSVGRFPPLSAAANSLSTPPGEYDRKVETQRNRRGPAQAVEHVV